MKTFKLRELKGPDLYELALKETKDAKDSTKVKEEPKAPKIDKQKTKPVDSKITKTYPSLSGDLSQDPIGQALLDRLTHAGS